MHAFRGQIMELIETYGRNNVVFMFESPIRGADLEKSSMYHVPVRPTRFKLHSEFKYSSEDLITSIDLEREDGYVVQGNLSYMLIAWARGDIRIFVIGIGADGEDEYNEVFAKTFEEMYQSLMISNVFNT